MDILLRMDDKTATLIAMFMELGVAASEDFSEVDHQEWNTSEDLRREAQEIIKDIDDAIKYEFIVKNMGV